MTTNEIDFYFKSLCKRIDEGDITTLHFCSPTDCKPVARECHANVDQWVTLSPGRKAVRGWVVADLSNSGYLLIAHSVGQEDGGLYDITPPDGEPLNPNEPRTFVRHDGTVSEFEIFKQPKWSSVTYHRTPLTIRDIVNMTPSSEEEEEFHTDGG